MGCPSTAVSVALRPARGSIHANGQTAEGRCGYDTRKRSWHSDALTAVSCHAHKITSHAGQRTKINTDEAVEHDQLDKIITVE